MAKFELKLPKMGESVAEATITSWLKEVGDTIELDEPILEIATDKVDSEVPSEVEGVLLEKRFEVDDVVQVGQVLAVIETEGDVAATEEEHDVAVQETKEQETPEVAAVEQTVIQVSEQLSQPVSSGDRFYSPLVRNIAKKEGISQDELDAIPGSGKEGRVTKNDILAYLGNRQPGAPGVAKQADSIPSNGMPVVPSASPVQTKPVTGEDEIIEMTRMGKLIA
ncbi:MAG: E3 binding domain-containing protein, partial [Bacteroidia bacterium]|nr:E3 binding domain-containing protein [Bacteroidia bacterium]